jgi:hypothetical protein
MDDHPPSPTTPSSHQATTGRQKPDHRGRPLRPHHRVSLARLATRVWRADNGAAAAEALGRGGHVGAHLACRPGYLGSARPARLVHGLSRRLVRTCQEGRREGRGNGLPLGFHLASAGTAEVKLAEQTLDTLGVSRPRGRPKRRPEKLVADRGYDSSAFRCALRRRCIRMRIPAKRRPATCRAKRGASGGRAYVSSTEVSSA